ncbi:MAG: tetratricopeptide repeat protein [Gemmatimonadetes bacterium]|nr:alpha/beta hydrolase-fold protein [Gemmatimonadota bacterium]MYA41332.1 tetratricopeptide repeat protein [Gemmatimonadota bacterium]MYE92633.1 tetratricopeptide repeat protein [Gemmatimonadota bacterium]MYJ11792.1 tetratricopeptide repeat protein [Gemmatimonadota bacterium]
MIWPTHRETNVPIFLSVLLLLFFIAFAPHAALAQDTEPFLSLGERRELHSDVLGEQREIIVGVPAGYEGGDETYPVVYLLDGPSHFHHTTGTARFLARNGRMPGVIVVAIANTDRTRDMSPPIQSDAGPPRPGTGGADNFLEFISGELMPFIDERYRTRPYAILIGHSLGGLFANHALVHRPDVFNAYVSISPSLWWDEQRLVVQADSAFDHAGDLVGDFYMTMGNEGGAMLGGALKFAGILEAKAPEDFRWEFKLMEEESHGSVPHRSTYYGLEKIFDGWNLHDPVGLYVAAGLEAVDRHFARASARFGYERTPSVGILGPIGGRALEDGNADDAEAVFSRLIEMDPNLAPAHNGLAEAHTLMGHQDLAIEHYQHALRIDPRNGRAREKLTEYGVDLSDYPESVDVPVSVLESYVGTYVVPDDPDEVLRFLLAEGELAVELEGRTYELYPTSPTRFKVTVVPVYVTFRSDEDGNVTGVAIDQAGETTEATRVK